MRGTLSFDSQDVLNIELLIEQTEASRVSENLPL